MSLQNQLGGKEAHRLHAVVDQLRLIHQNVPVEGDIHLFLLVVPLAGAAQILVHEPQQILKGRLVFRLHLLSVQFNVLVNGLDVHLIGVAGQPGVLDVIGLAIFDQSLLEYLQNNSVILCIDLHRQRPHIATGTAAVVAHLDCSILAQVPPKLPQVLPIVIDYDQNRVSGVLAHVVFKDADHQVDPVLQALAALDQRDLMRIAFERNQRYALPVVRDLLMLAIGIMLFDQVMSAGWVQQIRNQVPAVQLIAIHAIAGIHLKELKGLFRFPFISIHLVQPAKTVQLCVLLIRPEGDDFIVVEPFKLQLALLIVVGVQIANPAADGITGHALQGSQESLIHDVFESGCILVILGSDRKRL